MGRSRGGLTTKIHALVDAKGRPVALKLTPGQAHDGRSAFDMLDRLGEGDILLADSAYDSNALRQAIEERGAWACIKPMPGQIGRASCREGGGEGGGGGEGEAEGGGEGR